MSQESHRLAREAASASLRGRSMNPSPESTPQHRASRAWRTRVRGRRQTRLTSGELEVPVTTHEMIVHHAHGLQVGVDDS